MATNVFLSYKRPPLFARRCLARSLATALTQRWSEGRIVIDFVHAAGTDEFATRLVDEGLNQCIAVAALVDIHWLHQRSCARLGATDDWITFEISYGFEHNLFVILVCDQPSRERLKAMTLPGSMARLKSAPWFEWRYDAPFDEQVDRLVVFLRARLAGHARLHPRVWATAADSRPTVLTETEAEQRLQDATWTYRAVKVAAIAGLPLLVVGVGVALWGIAVMLDHAVHGLMLVGIAAVLLAIATWARALKRRYLERRLTSAARKWR